jgi:hypothetical protein
MSTPINSFSEEFPPLPSFPKLPTKRALDWSSVIPAKLDLSLDFFAPVDEDGQTIVRPPIEVAKRGMEQWDLRLVARFIGKVPSRSAIYNTFNWLWGSKG